MDHSQSGARSVSSDTEGDRRVEHAASADVRRLLRSARRRRRERWVVSMFVMVAVALVIVLLFHVQFGGTRPGSRAPDAPATGTAVPSERATLVLDLTHPYARTPAAAWPDGAAGIVPPTPAPVGGFTAEQVAAATGQVRDVLIASRLDPRLIVHHDPGAFLGALAPDARRQLQPLFGSGREAEVQSLVSLAAAGSRLLPVEPKVTGRMSVTAGGPGELVVRTNYVFVYAFHTDAPDTITDLMDILIVVRAEVDYVLRTGDRWIPSSKGWWYGKTAGYAYSIACKAYRKGFLAPAFTERTAIEASGQDRDRYFDLNSPLPPASSCPQ